MIGRLLLTMLHQRDGRNNKTRKNKRNKKINNNPKKYSRQIYHKIFNKLLKKYKNSPLLQQQNDFLSIIYLSYH